VACDSGVVITTRTIIGAPWPFFTAATSRQRRFSPIQCLSEITVALMSADGGTRLTTEAFCSCVIHVTGHVSAVSKWNGAREGTRAMLLLAFVKSIDLKIKI
jgi:hypothetical protein